MSFTCENALPYERMRLRQYRARRPYRPKGIFVEKQSEARKNIVEAYKALALESKNSDVSVQAIAAASAVSRKTFYYHFSDRTRLIYWIFRSELAERLRSAFAETNLLYPHPDMRDIYPDLPFYARIAGGVRRIDGSQFFEILGHYLQENRSYYRIILQGKDLPDFKRVVIGLYRYAFLCDIHFILGGRFLPKETCRRLGMYFSSAAVANYFDALLYSAKDLSRIIPEEFSNINHDILSATIEGYFDRHEQKFNLLSQSLKTPMQL